MATAHTAEQFRPTSAAHSPMHALAYGILADGLDALPPADHECFDLADWQSAAQGAIDGGDTTELSWMLLRDRAYNEFEEWRCADFRHREDADFGNWLADRARWNRPNWYEGALTSRERAMASARVEANHG